MADPYPAPDATPPLRVLILGAATQGWYAATADDRRLVILPRLAAALSGWQAMGARLVASFDDDVLKVGEPADGGWTWFLIYEVPSLQTVADMLHAFRCGDGERVDRWFRLEAKVGRAFFPVEPVQP
jgi:hypothetical protein